MLEKSVYTQKAVPLERQLGCWQLRKMTTHKEDGDGKCSDASRYGPYDFGAQHKGQFFFPGPDTMVQGQDTYLDSPKVC